MLFDRATGKELRRWAMHVEVRALTFTPDGKYLASGNGTGTIYLLQTE